MAHELDVVLDAYHEQFGFPVGNETDSLAFASTQYMREKKRKSTFNIHHSTSRGFQPYLLSLVDSLYLFDVLTGERGISILGKDPQSLCLNLLWTLRPKFIKTGSDELLQAAYRRINNRVRKYDLNLNNWGKYLNEIAGRRKARSHFGKRINYSRDVLNCKAPDEAIPKKEKRARISLPPIRKPRNGTSQNSEGYRRTTTLAEQCGLTDSSIDRLIANPPSKPRKH